MKKLSLVILILICIQFKAFSQNSINNYKYIVIPSTYSFLSEEDKYQLNSLTKFLFNKYGYTAYLQNNELPVDLSENKCLALYANVEDEKGLFKTKLRIDLKDCGGNIVMSSKVGESREKQYEKAYNLALRDAFETFQYADYKYTPVSKVSTENSVVKSIETPIEVKQEKKVLKEEVQPVVEEKKEVAKSIETPKAIIEKSELKVKETKVEIVENTKNLLYAQPIANGFQVVDTTPKIVMILLETAKSNVYVVKDQNAIVYQEDGVWYLSKNNGSKVSVETLNIKF